MRYRVTNYKRKNKDNDRRNSIHETLIIGRRRRKIHGCKGFLWYLPGTGRAIGSGKYNPYL